jgi:flavin-binding protein dodecin
MSDQKRRLGDNQNPIQDSAIKLVRKIYNALRVQHHYAERAFMGKNKTIRDNNAQLAEAKARNTLEELKPWAEVIEAKENGVDVHSAPIKTHKLEIVAGREHKFGQYIIDKESKQLEFDFDKETLND